MQDGIKLDVEKLKYFCYKILVEAGVKKEESEVIADSLVDANVMGVDSHGVTRLADYVDRLERGIIENQTKLTVKRETETTTLLNANNGWGQYAGKKAMENAIEKAKKYGSSFVGVSNSNHFGTASYFTRMASDAGCLGIAMTNTSPIMVSWGAKNPTLGTNPISIAVPSNENGIMLDMATSNTARGRINLAAKNGESIPKGWAVTVDGHDTTDAEEALKGFLLPFGPKGSGLAMMIDIMTGVMTGAMFGEDIPQMYDDNRPQQLGHTFIVFDIESFMDLDTFKQRIDDRINQTVTSSPAHGNERVYMPGEIEQLTREKNLRDGIYITSAIYKELITLGKKYGVAME